MKPLLILSGPTAVGKTEISLKLAGALDGEIINADSMQVYRGMDIGTAKLSPSMMQGIPHHLFDICDPWESFDAASYKHLAKRCIDEIHGRGHLPILVGGTGFYIQAVLYDIDFTGTEPDTSYRDELLELSKEKGVIYLHEMLRKKDPESAATIHSNNVKRVIRALEYIHSTGELFSVHNRVQREKKSPYDFHYAVLNLPREILYDRIEKRVDQMIQTGLVDEVVSVIKKIIEHESMGTGASDHLNTDFAYDSAEFKSAGLKSFTSMQGLGYKEIASYLSNEISLDEAVYILKRDTRHFAKRQLTWFKREKDTTWYDKSTYASDEAIIQKISDSLCCD